MDLSSERSPDEATIMQRQLYRAGQTMPASKVPAPTPASVPTRNAGTKGGTAASDKLSRGKRLLLMLLLLGVGYYLLYGNSTQRKRVLLVLGGAMWLLMLGSISYCLFLPDLREIARERRAILDDPNLTWEQKREKIREIDAKLTPDQGRQVVQIDKKSFDHARNVEMHEFLKMSPQEQAAYLKKRNEERKQLQQRGGFGGGPAPRGGGRPVSGGSVTFGSGGGPGGAVRMVSGGAVKGGGGGPGGKTFVFFGSGGGPVGGKPVDPRQIQKTMLDNSSPETRAGMSYQRGLSQSLGLGPGPMKVPPPIPPNTAPAGIEPRK